MIRQRVERDGLAAEALGEPRRGLERSVRDEHARRARAPQVFRRQFRHLARADQQHGRAFERAEDFAAQLDGRVADRNRRGRDARLRADALGYAHCVVHEPWIRAGSPRP